MRLLEKAFKRIKAIATSVQRFDRKTIIRMIPRKVPTVAQLQHADLFLEPREKRIIGASSFVAFIALIGLFFSIRYASTVPTPAEGGNLEEVLVGSPRYINPLFATSDIDRTLTNIVFLPLCDGFQKNIPTLASSCEFSNNGKTITVTLANREWHDGTPVTNDDVLFTLQAMQNEQVGSPWFQLASRVTARQENNTIVITARQALPELKTLISLGVIPVHLWKDIEPGGMSRDTLNVQPIGSGPFKFKQAAYDAGGFAITMSFDVFEDFEPRRAHLDEIDFRFAESDVAAYDMFRTRQVDALFVTDPADTDDLVKRDVGRYEIIPPATVSLFFNPNKNTLFRKAEVRDAFTLAIDRAAIVRESLKGNGIPVRVPFPTSMLDAPEQLQVDTNIDGATEAFKKIKFASSTLQLGVPPLPIFTTIGEQIKKQLEPYGVSVSIAVIGSATAEEFMNYDLLLLGQDYGPAGNASSYWHSTASGGTGANYARYQIKEVDTWLEQLQGESTPEGRRTTLQKINKRLVTDDPAIFLFQPTFQYYVANKVLGVSISTYADPSDRFRTVADWYILTKRSRK